VAFESETCTVRPGEELDYAALADYLRQNLPGGAEGVEIEQFPHGHSNLVYLVRTGRREYILRRPPLGTLAPKAHDMAREYRILHAVHPHFPEAPEVFLLCEDPSVIGSAFFLMERRRGVVIRAVVPGELAAVPDYPRQVSEAFIDCLVRLHSIDVSQPGLSSLGKPDGFVERQVRGWTERWNRAKTAELPGMDCIVGWLNNCLPPSSGAALVHNDYKLDNVMLTPSGHRVEAVLDWEMTTLGDPLADLGLTMCYWTWAGIAAQDDPHPATPAVTAQPGWYTRDRFLERYAERTGRDLTHIRYYEILGIFKLAVILQQIYYRFHHGQTQDERFRTFDRRVYGLVRLAASLIDKGTVESEKYTVEFRR
jgi:aminoglycoside phosphotransferase (APT) family kinase protein